ncbi:MAG: N-acetyltransferase family protein [Streptomycetaceae bacterium]|jgi:phosphinothricin acetyltransferase|nr:MAG: N-acetyltransferase family protein [Streptomycetaceae bacterium]
MKIREATFSDISAITDIYNEVILTTNAIYRESKVNTDDRVKWFNQRVDSGFPVIVAEMNGEIVGYGAFNDFRFGEGYSGTVEHSLHVKSENRGNGVGGAIMAQLLAIALNQNRKIMVAGIDSENTRSIEFHARFGFIETARMPGVAIKHDKRLTLVLMQKDL